MRDLRGCGLRWLAGALVWQPADLGHQGEGRQEVSAVIVRVHHMREARLCMSGVRDWFSEKGYDWSDFLDNGILAEKLESHDDVIADQVCAIARKEHLNG